MGRSEDIGDLGWLRTGSEDFVDDGKYGVGCRVRDRNPLKCLGSEIYQEACFSGYLTYMIQRITTIRNPDFIWSMTKAPPSNLPLHCLSAPPNNDLHEPNTRCAQHEQCRSPSHAYKRIAPLSHHPNITPMFINQIRNLNNHPRRDRRSEYQRKERELCMFRQPEPQTKFSNREG